MIEPVGHLRDLSETAFPAAGSRFASIRCKPRRRLARHRLGSRWLAERDDRPGPVMVYLLREALSADRLEEAAGRLRGAASVEHRHVLPILGMDLAPDAGPCLLSAYPGTFEGLCTIAQAAGASIGGRLELVECSAAAEQVLGALREIQNSGVPHGAIRMDEVLIDSRGRVLLELVGVEAALGAATHQAPDQRLRAETLSVVRLVYELVTGVTVANPCLPAKGLVRRLPRSWSRWLDTGLDPGAGFADAAEALAVLPDW